MSPFYRRFHYSMTTTHPDQPCSVVLVRTRYAGNLGAAARAMANFGTYDLRLVQPAADRFSLEARAMASHGETLLEQAKVFTTLQDAVADCVWTGGASARIGGLFRQQNVLSIREGTSLARAASSRGRIAFIFGPEDHGLTNEEVSLCQYVLHIPAHPDYGVLNLAQAAAICLYEWHLTSVQPLTASPEPPLARAGELDRMFEHLEESLRAVHYVWGEKGPAVFHALRHLLSRAGVTQVENKLLHGLARQLLWYVNRHPPTPGEKKMPPELPEA